MRQFDVFENPSPGSRSFAPFVVVLQSHHLDPIPTVVVAPLVRDAAVSLSPFDVAVEVEGETLALAVSELGSVDRAALRRSRGNLSAYEDDIRRALSRLFTGF